MKITDRDSHFMRIALKEAEKAAALGEVPVGAVIVRGDKVISRAHNLREKGKNALCHAEIIAIDRACKRLGGWRLWECDMYVTLEPCPMCAGAIINSRIEHVFFGARDEKAGAIFSRTTLFDMGFNHKPDVTEGVLQAECSAVLSDFFRRLRLKRKNESK